MLVRVLLGVRHIEVAIDCGDADGAKSRRDVRVLESATDMNLMETRVEDIHRPGMEVW